MLFTLYSPLSLSENPCMPWGPGGTLLSDGGASAARCLFISISPVCGLGRSPRLLGTLAGLIGVEISLKASAEFSITRNTCTVFSF